MAKYVLMEFDDDNEADNYAIENLELALEGQRCVGVYKKPTKFCDCTSGFGMKAATKGGWTRGPKYGWWVHAKCGKPSKAWGGSEHITKALGWKNLISGLIAKCCPACIKGGDHEVHTGTSRPEDLP